MGSFKAESGSSWQVKRLEIKPKANIYRCIKKIEHWVIAEGTAKVEIDGKTSILRKNESTYIPLGTKHRLSNPFETPLILIEVQSGSYLVKMTLSDSRIFMGSSKVI